MRDLDNLFKSETKLTQKAANSEHSRKKEAKGKNGEALSLKSSLLHRFHLILEPFRQAKAHKPNNNFCHDGYLTNMQCFAKSEKPNEFCQIIWY